MNRNKNPNLSVLISSCDKFADLWNENARLYKQNWKDNRCATFLVTDNETERKIENIEMIVAEGKKDFPLRIQHALKYIQTPYVLVTLDDYFLIDPVDSDDIEYLIQQMKANDIQYLSLYNRRAAKKIHRKPLEKIFPIDLTKKYALTLYPAIWDVDFLKKTVQGDLTTPWVYEASLTKIAMAENANCQASLAGVYNILDVVRKGKVLHKAKRYFKKNGIDIGTRPVIQYRTEFKLFLFDVVSWYTPKWLFRGIKSMAQKLGMTFYSVD